MKKKNEGRKTRDTVPLKGNYRYQRIFYHTDTRCTVHTESVSTIVSVMLRYSRKSESLRYDTLSIFFGNNVHYKKSTV
jgi:hypothetical protein